MSRSLPTQRIALRALQVLGVIAVIVLLVGMFTTKGFFSAHNARAIVSSTGFVGIVAVGMTLIMISGAFVSLSLGTTAAVTAIFFVYTLKFGVGAAIVLTILLGA